MGTAKASKLSFFQQGFGNAAIVEDALTLLSQGTAQTAGFYAIAYYVSAVARFTVDTKVVMYRGSDSIPGIGQVFENRLLVLDKASDFAAREWRLAA